MDKRIMIFVLGAVVSPHSVSADSVKQSIEGAEENTTQIVGDSNKVRNTTNESSSRAEVTNSIIINIQPIAKEIRERLPESTRSVAGEVSDIAVQLVEASATQDNSRIKDEIVQRLTELTLRPYQISSSPFVPPINKTQLMCDNTFKFAYRGTYQKGSDSIRIAMNNRDSGWLRPGDTHISKSNGKEVAILYLEFDKEKKSPVLHYECKITEES